MSGPVYTVPSNKSLVTFKYDKRYFLGGNNPQWYIGVDFAEDGSSRWTYYGEPPTIRVQLIALQSKHEVHRIRNVIQAIEERDGKH